jgi:hypothetical protein
MRQNAADVKPEMFSAIMTTWMLAAVSCTTREAALLGVVGWGVPVGLILALHEFLASSSALVVLPSLALWPFAGVAFGLAMRWLARRGHEDSRQA